MPTNIQQLNFVMQSQVQDEWCWAATSASASYFYNNATGWIQCNIACSALGRNDCCINAPVNPCNEPWYLDRALTITGNFQAPVFGGPLGINDIIAQIDAGKIICARVGWPNGDGHFVAIYGYNITQANPYIYVGDPIYGNSFINLNNFTNNYQGSGRWTHSYYTISTLGGMIQFTQLSDDLNKKASQVKVAFMRHSENLEDINADKITTLSYPHDTYLINFNSLLKGGEPKIENTGFRVIDSDQKKGQLIYDFSNSDPDANLKQVIHDTNYIQTYRSTLDRILENQRGNIKPYSLRLVKQPELKIEALWLHSASNHHDDKFVPVIAPSFLVKDEVYSESSFFSQLSEAARRKKPNNDELLGG